jgi:hypothetical protein
VTEERFQKFAAMIREYLAAHPRATIFSVGDAMEAHDVPPRLTRWVLDSMVERGMVRADVMTAYSLAMENENTEGKQDAVRERD